MSSHSLCRLFSGCGGWGLFSSDCRGHCSGFSCRRAGAPGRVDSSSFRVQAQSLWRMGSVCGLWNILGPGIQSISPALQGGPPATGPSEKPLAPLSTPGNSNLYDGGLRRFWDVIGVFARWAELTSPVSVLCIAAKAGLSQHESGSVVECPLLWLSCSVSLTAVTAVHAVRLLVILSAPWREPLVVSLGPVPVLGTGGALWTLRWNDGMKSPVELKFCFSKIMKQALHGVFCLISGSS